jgi:hypothetical protein
MYISCAGRHACVEKDPGTCVEGAHYHSGIANTSRHHAFLERLGKDRALHCRIEARANLHPCCSESECRQELAPSRDAPRCQKGDFEHFLCEGELHKQARIRLARQAAAIKSHERDHVHAQRLLRPLCLRYLHTFVYNHLDSAGTQLCVQLLHQIGRSAARLDHLDVVCTYHLWTSLTAQDWLQALGKERGRTVGGVGLTLAKSSGYSGSPRFSPRMVRLTPNGLEVIAWQRAISELRPSGVRQCRHVSIPKAPALETPAASSAEPVAVMPPHTMGYWMPSCSVTTVRSIFSISPETTTHQKPARKKSFRPLPSVASADKFWQGPEPRERHRIFVSFLGVSR